MNTNKECFKKKERTLPHRKHTIFPPLWYLNSDKRIIAPEKLDASCLIHWDYSPATSCYILFDLWLKSFFWSPSDLRCCWIKGWDDQKSLCEMGNTLQFWDIIVFHLNSLNLVWITNFSLLSCHSWFGWSFQQFNSCIRQLMDNNCQAYWVWSPLWWY